MAAATESSPTTLEQGSVWQYDEHLAPVKGHVIALGQTQDGQVPTEWRAHAVLAHLNDYYTGSNGLVYLLQRRAVGKGAWSLAPDYYGSTRDHMGKRRTYITQEAVMREFINICQREARSGHACTLAPHAAAHARIMEAEQERLAVAREARARSRDRAVAPLAFVLEEGRLLLAVVHPDRQDRMPFYVSVPYRQIIADRALQEQEIRNDATLAALTGQLGALATAELVEASADARLENLIAPQQG
jgi:hypothetical protein